MTSLHDSLYIKGEPITTRTKEFRKANDTKNPDGFKNPKPKMSSVSKALLIFLVRLSAVIIGWSDAAISNLPDTYGREFFLPYIDYSPWLLTLDVVPTFWESPNITVSLIDHLTGKITTYNIPKYGELKINYTDVINEYEVTEFSGTHVTSTEEVSIYVKIRQGDVMTVFPVDTFDYEFLIPQRSSPLDYSLIFIFSRSSNTTLTTSCNLTGDTSLNMSHDRYGDQTVYKIGAYETLKLETSSENTIRMKSTKPIGVIFITVDVLYDTDNASFQESTLIYLEFVHPLSAWGKNFFAVSFFQYGSLTFSVSAEFVTNVTLRTRDSTVHDVVGANSTQHFMCANVTVVHIQTSSPVQIFVIQANDRAHHGCKSSYFLPPVEQYLLCLKSSSCTNICPSFTPVSLPRPSASHTYDLLFTDASPSSKCTVNAYSEISNYKLTVATVELSNSYMVFQQYGASGSVIPMGSRLSRLYSACVQTIVANGGDGDGVDNDCDGRVDEEILNMRDDDGDARVDEDTAKFCTDGENSRSSRSKVQKTVAEVFFSGVDYKEDDSQKPLIAVIVSLCVSIFAVFAVISIFLLLELISRRNQLRNTKIRPFVS